MTVPTNTQTPPSRPPRKIIHVDMDAFYASVEQRDNHELRGKPVVVGGRPDSRSVVAAASYEARAFGIRSAMSCAQAARLCPQAIFVPVRFDAYRAASREIMEIFHRYTDMVEPLSLDEAYLDVTENKVNMPSATLIAEEIRAKIFHKTQLTASAGVAPNKFLAKIASDMKKPNGLTVITPQLVAEVLRALPVRKIPGVGKVTEERLAELKILTTHDVRQHSEEELRKYLGKFGGALFRYAHGIDERQVSAERERKSVGVEDTFSKDLVEWNTIQEELIRLTERAWTRLHGRLPRCVTVKITYRDFERSTRSRTQDTALRSADEILRIAKELLENTEVGRRPIRLLGVSLSHFLDEEETSQSSDADTDKPQWRQLLLPHIISPTP